MANNATDDFNRANLGGNWTLGLNTVSITGSVNVIGTVSVDNSAWWNANAYSGDHFAGIMRTNGVDGGGPLVRHQNGTNTFYSFSAFSASGANVYEVTAGTFVALGAAYSGLTVGANHTLGLDATGSTLTPYVDGIAQATRSDSTITGGAPGVHCSSSGAPLDNWIGAELSGITTIFIIAGTSQTSPSDWNNSSNEIGGIGGGGSGGAGRGTAGRESGGGAGEYREIANFSVATPGTTAFNYVIGAGGAAIVQSANGNTPGNAGADTTFNTSSLVAKAGGAGAGVGTGATCNGGAGGTGGTGASDNADGGRGGNVTVDSGASGGGGAGGEVGVGNNGTDSAGTATAGGAGDIAFGGPGGATGANGGNGQEWDATHGSGGGGGGDSQGGAVAATGGTGGNYGGGGGAARTNTGTATSGAGKQGIIILSYTPAVASIVVGLSHARIFRPGAGPTRRLTPTLAFPPRQADLPPEMSIFDEVLFSVLSSWQPGDPNPFIGGRQPLEGRRFSSGIPGRSVDQPPIPTPENFQSVYSSWLPPDPPVRFEHKLAPGIPGQSVDNPPVRLTILPTGVLVAWIPPDPQPVNKSPLSPGIPGQSVDKPPGLRAIVLPVPELTPAQPPLRFVVLSVVSAVADMPFVPRWLSIVLASWAAGDPPIAARGLLNPSITAVQVDDPPRRLFAPLPWPSLDPLPTLPGKLSPGIPGQSVDAPPPATSKITDIILRVWQEPPARPWTPVYYVQAAVVTFTPSGRPWLSTVVAAWQPTDPAPQIKGPLSPGIPGQSVDQPPIPTPENFWSAYSSWLPADPPIRTEHKLSPGIPGQSVDQPPPFARRASAFFEIALPPQTKGQLSPGIPGQSVDNPPPLAVRVPYVQPELAPVAQPRSLQAALVVVAAQVPFLRAWLSTVIASWILADPTPIRPRWLNPSITAVRVDNPPFGLRQPLGPIYTTWQPPAPAPWISHYAPIFIFSDSPPGTPGVDDEAARRRGRRDAIARSASLEASPRGQGRNAAARDDEDDEAQPRGPKGPATPRLH